MRKTLTFDNISLSDYNCYYDGSQMWKKPQRMYDMFSVVGKNGDLAIDQKRYSNITRPFDCYIPYNFKTNYSALIDYLSSINGYARLECSEESDIFMMGLFKSEIEPSTGQYNRNGQFTLEFDCKPQKWLKSGENAISVSSSTTLVNPTHQVALPLIEVVGTGSITINDSVLTLATNTSTTFIDCEIQDAYEGTINRNGDLTITNGFPVLTDSNDITVSGFTSVKIYPRWWRL